MADAYRTRGDISIPRIIATEGEGENRLDTTESVLYPAGSYVLAEDMTPRDRERAANGELDHMLESADLNEAREAARSQANGPDSDFGIFVPEHEAEAHALGVYGHTVVPPEQALGLGSASADYARDYQGAVREHGLDHRPVQEHFAQGHERVPDEVLTGTEHRTGLPSERGPVGYGEGEDAEQGTPQRSEQVAAGHQQVSAEVAAAPRQRPGSTQQPENAEQQRAGEKTPTEQSGAAQAQTPAQASPAQAPPTQPGPVNPQGQQ